MDILSEDSWNIGNYSIGCRILSGRFPRKYIGRYLQYIRLIEWGFWCYLTWQRQSWNTQCHVKGTASLRKNVIINITPHDSVFTKVSIYCDDVYECGSLLEIVLVMYLMWTWKHIRVYLHIETWFQSVNDIHMMDIITNLAGLKRD